MRGLLVWLVCSLGWLIGEASIIQPFENLGVLTCKDTYFMTKQCKAILGCRLVNSNTENKAYRFPIPYTSRHIEEPSPDRAKFKK